jgi:hypothetical protein
LLEALHKAPPIWKLRQRVVERVVCESLLREVAITDITQIADKASDSLVFNEVRNMDFEPFRSPIGPNDGNVERRDGAWLLSQTLEEHCDFLDVITGNPMVIKADDLAGRQ